jgi:hypothetical protein
VLLLALAGIASAAWQHFYAAPSGSCNLTLADKIINGIGLDAMLPDVFAPRATCADAGGQPVRRAVRLLEPRPVRAAGARPRLTTGRPSPALSERRAVTRQRRRAAA